MTSTPPTRPKTFPLELADPLHKALKVKAIETNQTLHALIINTLTSMVREEPGKYFLPDARANIDESSE